MYSGLIVRKNDKMKKYVSKSLVIVAAVISMTLACKDASAVATIFWGTSTSFFALDNDGVTHITGNASSSVAGLVQLVYLGSDGVYNGFQASGTGVKGDDSVLQSVWMGFGTPMSAFTSGQFASSVTDSLAAGSKFMILFFDAPSPVFGTSPNSTAPTTGFYGQSAVFTSTGDPASGGTDTFNFTSNLTAGNPVAVPEPTTIALMLAGLGMLVARRFVRA